MRLAFTLIGGKNWTGGQNYLLNLLNILAQDERDRLNSVLFVSEVSTEEEIASFAAIPYLEVVRTPLLNPSRKGASLLQAMLLGRDIRLQRLFRQYDIDIVFESAQFFGWRLGLPAIAWIPDFQHRMLPHLFSRGAWLKREIGFRAQVFGGRTIMLSSEDARRACEFFYPSTKYRTRTVSFAIPPSERIDYEQARAVADLYELPEHFFFMPNQFWRHKNHTLVLDALALLKERGLDIVVAASGRQADPRDPDYFPGILERLERQGLKNEFRLLGLIPYQHLSALLRASIALLNPSLFEGWSTTVEEARAMGTPMLLSDLDVHKEQMGSEATYFDRYSAQALATAMESFQPFDELERELRVERAKQEARQRVGQFAKNFVDLAMTCKSPSGRL